MCLLSVSHLSPSPLATASIRSWRASVTSTSMTLCTGTSRWVIIRQSWVWEVLFALCDAKIKQMLFFFYFSCLVFSHVYFEVEVKGIRRGSRQVSSVARTDVMLWRSEQLKRLTSSNSLFTCSLHAFLLFVCTHFLFFPTSPSFLSFFPSLFPLPFPLPVTKAD